MPKYIDLDKFREIYGFGETCANCQKNENDCADDEKYSFMDLCVWLDDAEEVAGVEPAIYCKNCAWYESGFCFHRAVGCGCVTPPRKPDDYCSYGEARDVPVMGGV